jgi:hypothetical protein
MIDSINLEHVLQLAMEGLFYVTTLIFVGFSLSLVYHWFAYGVHKTRILIMLLVYLGVSSVLFIGMSLSLSAL